MAPIQSDVAIACLACFSLLAFVLSKKRLKSSGSTNTSDNVLKSHELLTEVVRSNESAVAQIVKAMELQASTITVIQKEKELLEQQLNAATDALSDFEVTDDEEDEEEEGEELGTTLVKKPQTMAEDKLATIRALLTDAMKRNEQVNPASLLGIVTFNNDDLN